MVTPPMAALLAGHPIVEKYNLKSLQYVTVGAAPTGRPLLIALYNRMLKLAAPDFQIYNAYGLSETSKWRFLPSRRTHRRAVSIDNHGF
jgi:4-coumarate--CoA ligase